MTAHECPVCLKLFISEPVLTTHLHDHGLFSHPYKCMFCHNRYNTQGDVDEHTKGHLESLKLRLDEKGRIVDDSEDNSGMEYTCMYCQLCFDDVADLQMHHKTHFSTVQSLIKLKQNNWVSPRLLTAKDFAYSNNLLGMLGEPPSQRSGPSAFRDPPPREVMYSSSKSKGPSVRFIDPPSKSDYPSESIDYPPESTSPSLESIYSSLESIDSSLEFTDDPPESIDENDVENAKNILLDHDYGFNTIMPPSSKKSDKIVPDHNYTSKYFMQRRSSSPEVIGTSSAALVSSRRGITDLTAKVHKLLTTGVNFTAHNCRFCQSSKRISTSSSSLSATIPSKDGFQSNIDQCNTKTHSHGSNTEIFNHGSNTEMLSHGSNTEMLSHGSNTEILNRGTNTEMLSCGSNTEMLRHESNADICNRGSNTESLHRGSNTETCTRGSNTETLSHGSNTEMCSCGTNSETRSHEANTEMLSHGSHTGVCSHGSTKIPSHGSDTELCSHLSNTERLSHEANTEKSCLRSNGETCENMNRGSNIETCSGSNTDSRSLGSGQSRGSGSTSERAPCNKCSAIPTNTPLGDTSSGNHNVFASKCDNTKRLKLDVPDRPTIIENRVPSHAEHTSKESHDTSAMNELKDNSVGSTLDLPPATRGGDDPSGFSRSESPTMSSDDEMADSPEPNKLCIDEGSEDEYDDALSDCHTSSEDEDEQQHSAEPFPTGLFINQQCKILKKSA
ncbi:uncharacterized protein LOC121385777 [Gigantopelta aegis]|uniref:uncharacterized protein LOC121385777 n=1 Tax=Gigantopelta aegis TaxID=1735272 RepID=UPI001B88C0FC|nr:uncharacterized protein LOC121385777 [Gigantopelta aegis]